MVKKSKPQPKAKPAAAPARFSRGTLEFIQKASRQKKPEWLDRNREEYEAKLLNPLHSLAREIKSQLADAATGYHFPMRGLGRLKRSKIGAQEYGTPFRDYVSYSARRPSESRFDHNPNLFLLIYPDDEDGDRVLIAGGLYMPSSRQLRSIREAIATDATAFDRLFASKAFSSRFAGGFSHERKATRPPRGFDPTHPRLDWLKLQAYFVWRPYKLSEFTSAAFADTVSADFRQILRLNVLLEQAISGRWTREVREEDGAQKKGKNPGLLSRLENLDADLGFEAPKRKMDF